MQVPLAGFDFRTRQYTGKILAIGLRADAAGSSGVLDVEAVSCEFAVLYSGRQE